MRVYMLPQKSNLGIGRVVEAYHKYLPQFGVEFVATEQDADLIVVHAAEQTTQQPDIVHCHGLYPTAVEDKDCQPCLETNQQVIANLRKALKITVPADWVASILRRDMNLQPEIIPHGINLAEWHFNDNVLMQPYVLWGKGHNPGVVDPTIVNQVAELLPDVQFVTTFGQSTANVKVMGVVAFDVMREWLQGAAVYLATTKETFGIQTLEAMACGCPVVGYNLGATAELITPYKDGWLTDTVQGLADGIIWALSNQSTLRINARETASKHDWLDVAEQLYRLYNLTWELKQQEAKQTYSVVIPCHNYAQYLPQAIKSVKMQPDVDEIIVVDDASTDGLDKLYAQYPYITFIHLPQNVGVAQARNIGIQQAKGEYITCLDADDWLLHGFVSELLPSIKARRDVGVVYGGLSTNTLPSHWPVPFDYHSQMTGMNCVPSATIFRKSAWARAGGYRSKYEPAEDAEFWLRIASVGYDLVKVTNKPVYNYRMHAGSLSTRIEQPEYKADKPWSKQASLTPFAAPGGWPVRNYDQPWVSVIIPVSDYHGQVVQFAVESVMLQSMPYWELIVVNTADYVPLQSMTNLPLDQAYLGLTLLQAPVGSNPSVARNLGVKHAHGDLLVFLDADDVLDQAYLAKVIAAYNLDSEHYIYTDWRDQTGKLHQSAEYEPEHLKLEAIHPVTALVPRVWHQQIGGFDETLTGWEDWDYYLKLASIGYCGLRLPQTLLTYNYQTGRRRASSLGQVDTLLPVIRERYKDMSCSKCGGKQAQTMPTTPIQHMFGPDQTRRTSMSTAGTTDGDRVTVTVNDGNFGLHNIIGATSRINYGMYKQGDELSILAVDQRAKPQAFIVVHLVEAQAPAFFMPDKPVVKYAEHLMPEATPPVVQEAEYTEGIDLELLDLNAIKRLDWDLASVKDAIEIERSGLKRQDVIEFFEAYVATMEKATAF